jgi:hypothetical protein
MKAILIAGLSIFSLAAACSKKDENKDGNSGMAKLALANSAADSAGLTDFFTNQEATTYTPSHLGVKILGVRLTQELDNTNLVSPVIWANPACKTRTTETTVDGDDGDINYGYTTMDGDCNDAMVTDYFELARSSALVNAELNSQALKVLPATYKYVTIDFCAGGAKTNNLSFLADGMTDPTQVKMGTCGINSVEANPPIVIADGEAVVVALAYSLADTVYDYGEGMGKGTNCYFSEDGSVRRCVNFPPLQPTFSKAE